MVLRISSRRFRLFVAAETDHLSVQVISEFAQEALVAGMVYLCAWGRGCERFHDIVDECLVEDDLGARRFVGLTADDVVMTTWHKDETLEEALDFFTTCAVPSDGFAEDSSFRLALSVGHPDWAVAPTAVPYGVFGDPQSLNLYAYVRNNPTRVVDTDGRSPEMEAALQAYANQHNGSSNGLKPRP